MAHSLDRACDICGAPQKVHADDYEDTCLGVLDDRVKVLEAELQWFCDRPFTKVRSVRAYERFKKVLANDA